MKKIGLNIILLLFPVWLLAHLPEGKFKKLKTIQRTFEVGNAGQVFIDNSYGNINIVTGNYSNVEIIATIKVDGNDSEAVDKRFNSIDIQIEKNGNNITAQTYIGTTNRSWSWFSWLFDGKSSNTNFKIDYQVKMPEQWHLKINNEYGNIYLNKLTGNLNLNADYGGFDIGELNGSNNYFNLDYFKTSNIDYVRQAVINADYSKVNIHSAYKLSLNCDYSHINIEEVRKIKFNNDYGSIIVKNVKEVSGNGDGGNRVFNNVNLVNFNGDYGSLRIDGLLQGFEKVNITGDYLNIKIDNNNQVPYRFELNQEYGCFKYDDLEVYREIIDNGDKKIKAYYKDKNSSSVIKIYLDYGCVKVYN